MSYSQHDLIALHSPDYPVSQGAMDMHTFDYAPLDKWLTSRQIANQLPDITYDRVVQVLRELREHYADIEPLPYTKIGRSWLYHPDFVALADSRDKTPGVKPSNSNQNDTN